MPSKIEWTDETWNPLAAFVGEKRGWFCTKPSPGCKNCYAERINLRLGNGLAYSVANLEKIRWELLNLDRPKEWRKGRMIFVNSMTDLFHESVPDEMIGRVWSAMLETPQHTFQVLTKRAERMRYLVPRLKIPSWMSRG